MEFWEPLCFSDSETISLPPKRYPVPLDVDHRGDSQDDQDKESYVSEFEGFQLKLERSLFQQIITIASSHVCNFRNLHKSWDNVAIRIDARR